MSEAPIKLSLLLLYGYLAFCSAYNVPQATIKVNSPQGFEVSIQDAPGISLFAFHGKVHEEMLDLTDQTWAADIVQARNGRWTYHNRNHKLRPGDVLHYWTTARYNGIDYHNYNQQYRVDSSQSNSQRFGLRGKDGTSGSIVVHGQPTINIFVA